MNEATEQQAVTARRPLWILLSVLLVAAGVRLWQLGSLPPGVFRDEAEKALNGWFLLNDGVDERGKPWPIFIEVFGVTTSALYQYATIPFLAVGGLNEWTARLPAAVAGVLAVLFTWLFCRRVWDWKVAMWAAAFLALSPWHVPLSRWAQQGVFLPLLFVMAAWAIAAVAATRQLRITNYELLVGESASQTEDGVEERADETARSRDWRGAAGLMLGAGCMALAMYAYDPARLFAPLLGLAAAVIWWRVWVRRWRAVLAAVVVFVLVVSPVIWLLAMHGNEAQARFRFLSVFRPGVSFGEGLSAFVMNYLSHFSPDFLLLRGDAELRHSGGVGMLNFAEFGFAIAGAIIAIRQGCRWGWLMILWVLLAPVAASLTREGVPHALRSQMALPAWQVLAALGVCGIADRVSQLRARSVHQAALLLSLIGAMPFIYSFFGSYASRSAINWQYGVKQSLEFLNNPNTQNSKVVLTESVVGGRYLAPFYLKMNRYDFVKMQAGLGRYRALPFMSGASVLPPDRQPKPFDSGPIAWVGLPGYGPPSSAMAVPISAPDGEDLPPVMLIYLNDELARQVTGQSLK